MAAHSAATFGISYFGPTQLQSASGDIWSISGVDLYFDKVNVNISIPLFPTADQEIMQYPAFWIKHNTNEIQETRDTLYITPETAKTISFAARIFRQHGDEVCEDCWLVPHDELVAVEEGKCYWIQITNLASCLKGSFVEVSESDLEQSIRFVRLKPDSMIHVPLQEVFLSKEQEEIYHDYEGIAYEVDRWINHFANKVNLPPVVNDSTYLNLAKKELRKLIEQMSKEMFEGLLQLKKEGEASQEEPLLSTLIEEYQQELAAAIGFEGYVELMRKLLAAFAGDKASFHREIIEEVSREFARNVFRCSALFP